jgi:hypothetical protein
MNIHIQILVGMHINAIRTELKHDLSIPYSKLHRDVRKEIVAIQKIKLYESDAMKTYVEKMNICNKFYVESVNFYDIELHFMPPSAINIITDYMYTSYFKDIIHATTSANGSLSNFRCLEKVYIDKIIIPSDSKIRSVICNSGYKARPDVLKNNTLVKLNNMTKVLIQNNVKMDDKKIVNDMTSDNDIKDILNKFDSIKNLYNSKKGELKIHKRGRKTKKEKKLNVLGEPMQFKSQFRHEIESDFVYPEGHIYGDYKVFVPGKIVTVGNKMTSIDDILDNYNTIAEFIEINFPDMKDVFVSYMCITSINFKTSLLSDNHKINVKRMFELLTIYKRDVLYDHVKKCPYDMKEINKNQSLLCQFIIDAVDNTNKKITIKIYPSGKINIDGCTSAEIGIYYYKWLNEFINMYPEVIYIPITNYPDLSD